MLSGSTPLPGGCREFSRAIYFRIGTARHFCSMAMERLYRIGEVARLLGEQPHTLRHWERQFGQPRPRRGVMGERLYSQQDVEILRHIQHMLRTECLTLPQARQRLGRLSHEPTSRATLELLRELLLLLLALLPKPPEQLSGE